MYIPKHFVDSDPATLHELIRSHPLATLVCYSPNGLNVNHVPLHFTQQSKSLGTLSGHIARANSLCKNLTSATEVLVIFHGPQAYITPSWYPTKAITGMVVPTWNYVVVHVQGVVKLIEDTDWLRAHLAMLTAEHEAAFEQPWKIEDAPADFIHKMMTAVVGIEIEITNITGKSKSSQNQSVENQLGVINGLSESYTTNNLEMAATVQRTNQL